MQAVLDAFKCFQESIRIDELPLELDPNAPVSPNPQEKFDVFSLMGEWIALKQELKNQNKIQHNTQVSLEKALEEIEAFHQLLKQEENQRQQEIEATKENIKNVLHAQKEQEMKRLIENALPALDSLDFAIQHWEKAHQEYHAQSVPWFGKKAYTQLGEMLEGSANGLSAVRERFWKWLEPHGLSPCMVVGKVFDPATMMAVGQHIVSKEEETYRVHAEVLRGYLWKGILLRSSEVIVTIKPRTTITN
ncbi:nucleotide exchange factor GrpE [Deltaproteobacteria bacterium TL4]